MADIDNLAEINENFDTVKTLLNSIRAQGILNTSDVDKLLSGINAKLEKINTEEDIDLIKVFLSELKKSLDERHGVLISKFGAIESLFSNLLKNSNELTKASELKELFDIVATNLSVFSREVVSQKEALNDITMRLDSLRSDDSQKNDIIKNIALLKPDLERLNNGFDTIVISLNDNFKTLAKTLSTIDKTEYLDRFSGSLNNLETSSSALFSALQILDKKTEEVDNLVKELATKSDLADTGRSISELKLLNQGLNESVTEINRHYSKIDNLADKIDASVNVIAGLKSALDEAEDKNARIVLENLDKLSNELRSIKDNEEFESLKAALVANLNELSDKVSDADKSLNMTTETAASILETLRLLDVNTGFSRILSAIEDDSSAVKSHIDEKVQDFKNFSESNLSKIVENITHSADDFSAKMAQSKSEISALCADGFGSVVRDIADLKKSVTDLDENNVSSSNAMFSNITDRFNLFEAVLRESLTQQESVAENASAKLCEQVENIKNLSGVLDYKMDSSVVEISSMKMMFETLKASVDDMLALNFTGTVKDLRADIYASKQDLANALEASAGRISENTVDEINGKYQLVISKLDSVEEEFKKTQMSALDYIKGFMDQILSSLVDITSYVSESKEFPLEEIDKKISGISDAVKEASLNYIDNMRNIAEVIRVQAENDINTLKENSDKNLNLVSTKIDKSTDELKEEIKASCDKLLETSKLYEEIKDLINLNTVDNSNGFEKLLQNINSVNSEFDSKLTGLKNTLLDKISGVKAEFFSNNTDKVNEFKLEAENMLGRSVQNVSELADGLKSDIAVYAAENDKTREEALNQMRAEFGEVKAKIEGSAIANNKTREEALNQMRAEFGEVKAKIDDSSLANNKTREEALNQMRAEFGEVKAKIDDSSLANNKTREEALNQMRAEFDEVKAKIDDSSLANNKTREEALNQMRAEFDEVKSKIEAAADGGSAARTGALAKILDNFVGLKEYVQNLNSETSSNVDRKTELLIEYLESVKAVLKKVDENVDGDMTRQLSIIESNFESLVSQMTILNEKAEQSLAEKINDEYKNISSQIDENVNRKFEEFKVGIEDIFSELSEKSQAQSAYLQEKISDINSVMTSVWNSQSESNHKQIEEMSDKLKSVLESGVEASAADYTALKSSLDEFTENLKLSNEDMIQNLKAQLEDMMKYMDSIIDVQSQESDAHIDELIQLINNLSSKNTEIENKLQALQENSTEVNQKIEEKSSTEIDAINEAVTRLNEQLALEKEAVEAMKDFVSKAVQNKLNNISSEIEKETDTVLAEISEQFELIKKSQQDVAIQITSGLESVVESKIYDNIDDLKSYLDVKMNNTVLSDKVDNLKLEITALMDNTITDLNKMLSADVFTAAISDYRVANEILVNSAADRINEKIANFISETAKHTADGLGEELKNIENKLALFDKGFVDTIVDKYEEIKLESNKCNSYLDEVNKLVKSVFSDFQEIKGDLNTTIGKLSENVKILSDNTNSGLRQLNESFNLLRSQISNKSLDEAFQAAINKQVASLEDVIKEQMSYVEDINDLCGVSLPDLSELSIIIKGSVLESLDKLNKKTAEISDVLGERNIASSIETALKSTKSDIITQFLNIFNQISFVAEQEEIIEYIQDRHDELIKILSHIVMSTADVSSVKDNVTAINDKMESLKDEISLINEKITNIISSEGDIDYIYSLQDLESDIANFRVVLKNMQDNSPEYGGELENLMSSTEKVYKLVESIKDEMPDKNAFENLTEDIVSISSRTNKLILASDESYKTLQENLQDFKLVINDLDERTRNFAHESGMDRIDSKLNALNTMVQNGAKSNQVFNQVFEYLAEWIDSAGNQINAISNSVEKLDDISQIKVMLADMRAEAEDNSESIELIESLGKVFEKQAGKIASLEAKLDKMIVENTINNSKNKLDMKPMEETLNRFLTAIGDKMTSQQEKINTLEAQLEKVAGMLEEKDTAQLSKKMGGMDRQIAKLNKSIEKIASHVVEK